MLHVITDKAIKIWFYTKWFLYNYVLLVYASFHLE